MTFSYDSSSQVEHPEVQLAADGGGETPHYVIAEAPH